MGEITEKRRRDYSGLDADKASIPAVGKAVNDTFLATDTKILYFWDGVAWIIIPLDVITAGMLKTDAVETAKIKDLNVTVGKLAGGITATKLAADCVETAKIKDLNVTKGKAELGFGRYVPLSKGAWDWNIGDITDDGAWHLDGLDCGAKGVAAGATGVVLAIIARSTGAGSEFLIRPKAGDEMSGFDGYSQVANVLFTLLGVIPIESNLLLDYNVAAAFDTWSVAVIGYFT